MFGSRITKGRRLKSDLFPLIRPKHSITPILSPSRRLYEPSTSRRPALLHFSCRHEVVGFPVFVSHPLASTVMGIFIIQSISTADTLFTPLIRYQETAIFFLTLKTWSSGPPARRGTILRPESQVRGNGLCREHMPWNDGILECWNTGFSGMRHPSYDAKSSLHFLS